MAGRLADSPAEQARLEVSNGPGWRAHAISGLGCAHLPPLRGSLGWNWSSPTRPTRPWLGAGGGDGGERVGESGGGEGGGRRRMVAGKERRGCRAEAAKEGETEEGWELC